MKKILFSLFSVHFLLFTFALANPSPVVQVVAYKEPLGMYFSLQGWGTGSIIDSAGHILTNNHVVDDGMGGISDDFSICITQDPSLPPECHYTASVVARDPEKDIALLQLDPKDIFGNAIDFSGLTPLAIDYSYIPASGDAATAKGYPWVGSNTITQTQGIVSGTYEYNDNTYIKTDTLIAGGNSGGPLLHDGQMIGVNTFLIGGSFDPALGYSLSIAEAQDFITENLTSSNTLQANDVGFSKFLQGITIAQNKRALKDPLANIVFPEEYTLLTYIPGSFIQGQISKEDTTSVASFLIGSMRTPKLTTTKQMEFFLSKLGLVWGDFKFKTVTIGGQAFYEIDSLGNAGGNKSKTDYLYFKVVDQENLLLIYLSTPSSNETTYESIQKNITRFLSGITFPAKWDWRQPSQIDIPDADMKLVPNQGSLIDYGSNFLGYDGAVAQFSNDYSDTFNMRLYGDSLWSYSQISVIPNSFYTEGLSATSLLEKLKESPYFSQDNTTEIITYKGHQGFTICDSSTNSVVDDKGAYQPASICEVILLIGQYDSHFLSLLLVTEKTEQNALYARLLKTLNDTVILGTTGETKFGSGAGTATYSDVANQSSEYRETLKKLVKYGILSARPKFDGDHPMTWREYVSLHIWAVYHKRLTDHVFSEESMSPTFSEVIAKLPIQMDAYVDSTKRESFELMLRMRLADVTLPEYSETTLNQFSIQSTTKYRPEWKKIEEFEYKFYGGEKIGMNGDSYYNSGYFNKEVYINFNPVSGLSENRIYSDAAIKFGHLTIDPDTQKELDEQLACSLTAAKYFSKACYNMRHEAIASFLSYSVLTKGEALDALIPSIDFGLWDEDLAKKKNVIVEEEAKG